MTVASTRALRAVGDELIVDALKAGGAVRRFVDRVGENDKWVVYTSSKPEGEAVAVVTADRLAGLLAETHGILLRGDSAISTMEVASTVADVVDVRRVKLEAKVARMKEQEGVAVAALEAHIKRTSGR